VNGRLADDAERLIVATLPEMLATEGVDGVEVTSFVLWVKTARLVIIEALARSTSDITPSLEGRRRGARMVVGALATRGGMLFAIRCCCTVVSIGSSRDDVWWCAELNWLTQQQRVQSDNDEIALTFEHFVRRRLLMNDAYIHVVAIT
jgi:hypothetical protein